MNLPFVCWLQDAMPHWYDGSRTTRPGGYDFLAGYIDRTLRERLGYPERRCIGSELSVRPETFAVASAAAGSESRLCEIAMITNQSETVDQLVERTSKQVQNEPALPRVLRQIVVEVRELIPRAAHEPWQHRIEAITREALEKAIGTDHAAMIHSLIYRCFSLPAADLLIRHETAGWAADLAARRGWRLHLYGRGWAAHPTLAPFAQGPVEHGGALSAVSRRAGVVLHVSSRSLMHQRIAETLFAGGLILARRTGSDVQHLFQELAVWMRHRPEDQRTLIDEGGRFRFDLVDFPEALAAYAQLQRLGWSTRFPILRDGFIEFPRWHADHFAQLPEADLPRGSRFWTLLDLAETTFADPDEFETLVTRALERPAWRDAIRRAMTNRAETVFSLRRFADRVLDAVGHSFVARDTPRDGEPECSARE